MSKLADNKESLDVAANQLLKIIFAIVILLVFIISFFLIVFWKCEISKTIPLATLDVFILGSFRRVTKHLFPSLSNSNS